MLNGVDEIDETKSWIIQCGIAGAKPLRLKIWLKLITLTKTTLVGKGVASVKFVESNEPNLLSVSSDTSYRGFILAKEFNLLFIKILYIHFPD